MIMAQPGKRDVRQRADGAWMVFRYDPTLPTVMQWEIVRIFEREAEARIFAYPRRASLIAADVAA